MKKGTFVLTPEQQAVVDARFDDILLVNAYAGTGKTSTLVSFAEARRSEKILVLVYNNAMRAEGEKKFAHLPNVTVKTLHSLAYSAIGKDYKDRLGSLRAFDLIGFVEDIKEDERYYYAYLLLKLIREFANSSYDMQDYIKTKAIEAAAFKISNRAPLGYFLDRLPAVWEKILFDPTLPFEHDFYLKLYQLSRPTLPYQLIMVDEAQDISGVMMDIVLSQKKARKVFIGDTFQQLYSWRGAVNSLEILSRIEGVKMLHLSQSFRCPQDVAQKADAYLRLLGAPLPFKGVKKGPLGTSNGPLAVIARTNAKLFDYAVERLEEDPDTKFHFVGGIQGYNFQDLIDIQNLYFNKREYIRNVFIKRFEDIDELEEYAREANEIDLTVRIGIVRKYMGKNIRGLIREFESRSVPEKNAGLILTTGHKSKGLEWDRVSVLDDFVNLRKKLEGDGEDDGENEDSMVSTEEINLLYVAMTRTRVDLEIGNDYVLDEDAIRKIKDTVFFM